MCARCKRLYDNTFFWMEYPTDVKTIIQKQTICSLSGMKIARNGYVGQRLYGYLSSEIIAENGIIRGFAWHCKVSVIVFAIVHSFIIEPEWMFCVWFKKKNMHIHSNFTDNQFWGTPVRLRWHGGRDGASNEAGLTSSTRVTSLKIYIVNHNSPSFLQSKSLRRSK